MVDKKPVWYHWVPDTLNACETSFSTEGEGCLGWSPLAPHNPNPVLNEEVREDPCHELHHVPQIHMLKP